MTARYIFAEHSDADARIESGISLARIVLSGRVNLLESHLREVLRIAVCKVTEARTHKHKTRFCSRDAYLNPEQPVEHEHVHTVLSIRNKLLLAKPEEVEQILRAADACTVTKEEHTKLGNLSRSIEGWDRYIAAKIPVVDVKETQLRGALTMFLDPPS